MTGHKTCYARPRDNSAMAKFILIDQSITGLGGHNFEYAVRVLEAARTAGFDPYLATNREFRETKDLPCPVHPVYRYGFFSEPAPGLMTRMVGSLGRAWTAARGRMTYSQAGALVACAQAPGAHGGLVWRASLGAGGRAAAARAGAVGVAGPLAGVAGALFMGAFQSLLGRVLRERHWRGRGGAGARHYLPLDARRRQGAGTIYLQESPRAGLCG